MSRDVVDFLYTTYTYRFLAEGVAWRDLNDLRARIQDVRDWAPAWTDSARAAEERAHRALSSACRLTAGTELARAALHHFFAQFLLWQEPEVKRAAYLRCVEAFRRAAPLLDPPLERLDIPFRDITMPAYLRRLLLVNDPAGAALFGRWYALTRRLLDSMAEIGAVQPAEDPAVRAAFFLVNDLALVLLRNQIAAAIGVDPLTPEGVTRWAKEVTSVYTKGAFVAAPSEEPS